MKALMVPDALYDYIHARAKSEGKTADALLAEWSTRKDDTQTILDQLFTSNDAIQLLINPDTGYIEAASDAAVRFYGWSRSELLRMRIQDINTLDEADVEEEMARARQHERSFFQFRHRIASGDTYYVHVWSGRVYINGRDLLYSFITDVTDMINNQALVVEQRERLAMMIQGAQLGTWDWNMQNDTVRFNAQWARMLGYEPHEVGTDLSEWSDRLHPDDHDKTFAAFNAHLRGEKPFYEAEFRMRCKDGTWKWILDRGQVLARGHNGKPLRAAGVHIDIQAHKEAEARRNALIRERERVSVVRQFITDASHEFFTPLSIINSSTYILERGEQLSERGMKHVGRIQQAAADMTRLVQMLNAIVRLDAADYTPQALEAINVNEIIHVAVQDIQPMLDAQQQTISVKIDANPPMLMQNAYGDDLKLALIEMLRNAALYSPPGGHVEITLVRDGDDVMLQVSDNGMGIADEDFPLIFERFYRGDKAHTKRGFGLGLAIVERVVRKHQGMITVESEPDQKTTFCLCLPTNRKAADSNDDLTSATR